MTTLAELYGVGAAAPAASPVLAQKESPQTGAIGFLHNLWSDAESTVTGLGALGSQVVHDLGRTAANVVDPIIPGQGVAAGILNNVDPTGYHIPQIVHALPGAITHDYAHRYGGLSNIVQGFYQHPLSYLLDVSAAGDVAGKGAEFLAATALEDPAYAGAKAIAQGTMDQLTEAGGMTTKAARPAGLKAGLESLSTQRPLTPIEQVAHDLLPSATARRVGDVIVPYAQKNNPLVNAVTSPLKKLTTQPIEELAAKGDQLGQELANYGYDIATRTASGAAPPKGLIGNYDQVQRLLTGAQNYGLTRIQRDFPADVLLWKQGKSFLTKSSASGLGQREADLKEIVAGQKPFYDENPDYGSLMVGAPDGFHYDFQQPDPTLPQPTRMPWFTPERVGTDMRPVRILAPGEAPPVQVPALTEQARQAATDVAPGLLGRADIASERVAKYIDDLQNGTAVVPEGTTMPGELDAANRFLARQYEGVTRALDHANPATPPVDIVARGMDSIDSLNSTRELQMLGAGDSLEHIMQRKYTAMQLMHGAEIKDFAVSGGLADWRTLDDSLRAAGQAPPAYFPYIDESAKQNFFEYLTNRVRIGGRKMARDPNMKFFSGSALEKNTYITDPMEALSRRAVRYNRFQQVNNMWNGIINSPFPREFNPATDELASNEVLAAPDGFRRYFSKAATAQDTMDHLTSAGAQEPDISGALDSFLFEDTKQMAEKMGVAPPASPTDLASVQDFLHAHGTIDDLESKNVPSDVAAAWDRMGGIDGYNRAVMPQEKIGGAGGLTLTAAKPTVPPKVYAIPKTFARQMESYAHASGLFGNPFVRMFWDTPSNLWRSFVLQGSPRWVINNTLGNAVMMKLSGYGRIQDVLTVAEERWRQVIADKLGTEFHSDVLDLLNKVPGIDRATTGAFTGEASLYNIKRGSATTPGVENFFERLAGAVPSVAHKFGDFNMRLNSSVEDVGRQMVYFNALQRQEVTAAAKPIARMFWGTKNRLEALIGRADEITPGQIEGALREIGNTLGNFNELGPVERNVIRRFVFPFWGFYKHQAGMLARLPIESPIRGDVIRLLSEANDKVMGPYGQLPPWVQGGVPFGAPGQGEIPFYSSHGPNPFSASFQSIPSMLNPFAQIALSRGLGRNLYTGQKFEGSPHDYYTPFGSDQSYRYVRDDQGNVVRVEPMQGNVEPSLIEQILGTVPQYGAVKAALAGGQPYDTTTLAGILKARFDQTQGNKAPLTNQSRPGTATNPLDQLLKLSGLGTTPYNLSSYQQALLQGQLQALAASGGR
jgi:hypothetical protein